MRIISLLALLVSISSHAGYYRTAHVPMNSEVSDHINTPNPTPAPVAPTPPWIMV